MRNQYWWWQRRLLEGEGQGGGGGGEGGGGDGGAGGGAGGGQQQQQQDGSQQQQQQPAHWSLSLPEDLRGHETVKSSKDLADYVKQSTNAFSLVGRKGVIVPKADAPAEEWDKYYTDLGRPKAPTDYKVPERPDKQPYTDTDKAFMGVMLPELHKAGLTQVQLEGVANAYNGAMVKVEGVFKKFADDASAALDKQYGADRPKMTAAAERYARHVWGENYDNMKRIPLAGGGFLADHPMVVHALAQAGMAMAEDGSFGGGGDGGGDPFATQEAAQKYVDDLYAAAGQDTKHWLNHPESPEHKANREHLHRVQRFIAKKKEAAR